MSNAIVKADDVNLDDLQRMARMMVASGYFDADRDATKGIAQIAIKIMAGREMGYGPFASVQGIHVIQGKPSLSANLMAAAVKNHPRYDYRVRKMSNEAVEIEFFEDGQSIGKSEFTAQDAQNAGLTNSAMYKKFARNMLFARALSNGVRWYTPDVFSGNTVYVPEELGADVDGDGNVVESSIRRVDVQTGEIIEPAALPAPSPVVVVEQPQHRQHVQPEQPEVEFMPPVEANPFDAAPEPPAQKATNGKPKAGLITEGQKGTLHALGEAVYGDKWDAERKRLVTKVTEGRKTGPVTSSNDLWQSDADTLISGLDKKLYLMCKELVDLLTGSMYELDPATLPSIDGSGTYLAKAYKELVRLAEGKPAALAQPVGK